jgi:hypothetical protein
MGVVFSQQIHASRGSLSRFSGPRKPIRRRSFSKAVPPYPKKLISPLMVFALTPSKSEAQRFSD